MAESPGLDSLCEWVEITNTTDDTLVLDGLTVSDLGRNFATFPANTTVGPHEAVVIGRSTDRAVNCDTPVDVGFAEGFTLNDNVLHLTDETPDADELFAENVAQGTIGTGIEQGLENARLVFDGHASTNAADDPDSYYARNGSFLRDDATLSVLFVSDEDDVSPYPVHDYLRFFTDLKGDAAYRDRSLVNLSSVVGRDVPPREDIPACETDNGQGWYGRRYIEAANETGGLVESICAEDFAPIVNELGLTLSGLVANFELSACPNLDTLVVELYETDSADSFVRELERDVDFTYRSEGNLLRFEEEQVPPSEWYVIAEYVAYPPSVDCTSGSSE